jgi:hypothetical protein
MNENLVVPMSDEMVHLTDNANEDVGLNAEALFPKGVLERAALSVKSAAMMLAEYQRLRVVLRKP